ncbi:MAG: fimbria major subunit [Tannerella sp.]|jgi:hypothetical protein|nr:fimbria major subunit [Tannerella sp.]
MKRKKYIYLLLLLFIKGSLFFSCTDEGTVHPEPGPEPGPETPTGTEYLSVGVQLKNAIQTRAASYGIEAEWNLRNIRFILYSDGLTGSATLIHDYNITFNSNSWNITPVNDAPANLRIEGTLTEPRISKDFEKLIKQDYRLLVLVNHNSGADLNLNAIRYNNQSINSLMSGTNHSITILSTPIDLSLAGGTGKNKHVFDYGIGPGLTGLAINYPVYPANFNNAAFFMSNADGLVYINKDTDLHGSLATAQVESNRTLLNVERAVAKVGVFKGDESQIRTDGNGVYTLTNGSGKIASLTWTSDIINYYWFIVRKQANIAPSQGGNGLESSTNNRQYYYAEDPNYSGISELKTGQNHTGESAPSFHFFRVENEADIRRNWIENTNSSDEQNKFQYEYISENTMRADEQYEDVATRVLIRTNFIPLKTLGNITLAVGDSYYYYNGYALTHSQICYYLANPVEIAFLPVELQGLKNALFDEEVITEFGFGDGEIISPITRSLVDPDNPPKEPTVSKTKKGLTYYLHGISYYYIMIRHFSDTESPEEGGYGRYGVVRNNVYKITVEDITGPGYIDIPRHKSGKLRFGLADFIQQEEINAIQATTTHSQWTN